MNVKIHQFHKITTLAEESKPWFAGGLLSSPYLLFYGCFYSQITTRRRITALSPLLSLTIIQSSETIHWVLKEKEDCIYLTDMISCKYDLAMLDGIIIIITCKNVKFEVYCRKSSCFHCRRHAFLDVVMFRKYAC